MTGLRHELRVFFVALQFLTRLPVPHWVGHESKLLQRAVRHFPLVGALIGATGAAVALGALQLWPATVAATLAVAATVWLTAAFHEDGLADTFDALLGAAPREKALAIMKDSRIGSYGAAALSLLLLLRVLLLAELLARAALP
ncbi:adenosylcobinamide-GDP ribazoletransferase, partial [Methylibium sp. T29]